MDFLFFGAGVVEFIIICDEESLHTIKGFDKFHALFQPKGIADCAQRIPVNRSFGEDGDTVQVIVIGHSGFRIQDVVIDFSIHFKIPFIVSG